MSICVVNNSMTTGNTNVYHKKQTTTTTTKSRISCTKQLSELQCINVKHTWILKIRKPATVSHTMVSMKSTSKVNVTVNNLQIQMKLSFWRYFKEMHDWWLRKLGFTEVYSQQTAGTLWTAYQFSSSSALFKIICSVISAKRFFHEGWVHSFFLKILYCHISNTLHPSPGLFKQLDF